MRYLLIHWHMQFFGHWLFLLLYFSLCCGAWESCVWRNHMLEWCVLYYVIFLYAFNVCSWTFFRGALYENVRMMGCFGAWMIKLWVFLGVSLWNFIPPCMVWWCVLGLKIYNSHVLHVKSVLPDLKTLGEIKCCVRFSVPRDLVKTLSPLWNSGRELVWVLSEDSLTCVKQ